MKLTGKIIKILANFYYVIDIENKTWECFARARLLKEGRFLYVGDEVEIETSTAIQGVIVNSKDRRNKLNKPPIANIDHVLVIFSACEPGFDFYNLDRYLSFIRYELPNEKITVCINKIDLRKINVDKTYRNTDYNIFYISALTKIGLDNLAQSLTKTTTVLTGPSGVGKSTLIKALAPSEDIKIGAVSSIKQGKHITRNVQLVPFEYNNDQGFLVDTPGFTQFSFASLNAYKILSTFKELNNLECSFNNCLHNGEEGCVISNPKVLNSIPESKLESYHKILKESQSEVTYETKQDPKTKSIGGKKEKKKFLPRIDQELRAKSRRKEKQELLKFDDEFQNET